MFLRDQPVLRHVTHDVVAREQEVQLFQAEGVAVELLAQEGFHGAVKKGAVRQQRSAKKKARAQAVAVGRRTPGRR